MAGPVLFVYPFCLDHVGHGNIQRVLSMARYLASRGLVIDLVYQGNPSLPPVPDLYTPFRRVHRVEGGAISSADQAHAARLAEFYGPFEPPSPNLRPSAPLTALVRALIEAESYRAAVSSYAWTAPVFDGLARPLLRIVDAHDVLHEYLDARFEVTGLNAAFSISRATEEFLWTRWDALLAITPEDQARIGRALPRDPAVFCVRHAAAGIAPREAPGDDDVALYAGSNNPTNINSASWLIERVWPLVRRRRPRAVLRIAGLIADSLPDALTRAPGIEILGFRSSLEEPLARCGVFVAPYLYGSGLKIKVVEAACAGKAALTTSAGVVGTGLEPGRSIAVHDDACAMADALVTLLGDRAARARLARAALEHARTAFSPAACYEPIVRLVESFTPTYPAFVAVGKDVVSRVNRVVSAAKPERIVVWGNGSHTRSLATALSEAAVAIDLIVDRTAIDGAASAEGIPLVAPRAFDPRPLDLIVLSSQTFEDEMWRDVAPLRDRGAWVLGLYDAKRISTALRHALREGPAVVLWDRRDSSWTALSDLQDVPNAARERGWRAVVVSEWASSHADVNVDASLDGARRPAAPRT